MSGKKLAIQLIVTLLCMTAKMTYAQSGGAWIGPIQHWCYGGTDTDFDGWDDSFLCEWTEAFPIKIENPVAPGDNLLGVFHLGEEKGGDDIAGKIG